MRIYENCRELMSEMGRDLWEMGKQVKPKTYQNKVIDGNDEFVTKENICQQYCLTSLDEAQYLFAFTKDKAWAEAEFAERIKGEVNPGSAYKLRLEMWEEFLVQGKDGLPRFDYSYGERINQEVTYKGGIHKLIEAIAIQLAEDPDTRKAILPIYGTYTRYNHDEEGHGSPKDYSFERDIDFMDGAHRIPCSMYFDFLLRNGKLNICYHQRSSDFVQHFGNDVYLAWNLMLYMVELINNYLGEEDDVVSPGYLYHTIDSLHAYKKDWVYLKSNIDDYVNE